MVAGSILPITIHNNELFFLFGKENPMENSAKGWSDFGGRVDAGETIYSAALREGGEELTGFLGDNRTLRKLIKNNGGTFKLEHNKYHVHLFFLPYDENLPKYYNQNHDFLWKRMDKNVLNKTKLFEKIEIKWFSFSEMVQDKNQFRNFYQNIVDLFDENKQKIITFAKNKSKLVRKHNKTQKLYS